MGGLGFAAISAWPGLGNLPGDEGKAGLSGGMVSGVNINSLRNFFFEKIGKEAPSGGMLSKEIIPKRVSGGPNYNANLAEALGTNRIVSNSTPFPKTNSRIVKRRKGM